ncbi:MAG TPA: hypothetical protein VHE80_03910, partial [Acidimicrobiales bacterium]|nr:hypothetical protein [Acidimicrobiales bacterium]
MSVTMARPDAGAATGAAADGARPAPADRGGRRSGWAGLSVLAVAVVAGGLLVAGEDGLTAAEVVRAGLILAWNVAGLSLLRRRPHRPAGLIVLGGVTLGAVTFLATAAVDSGWRGVSADVASFVRPVGVALLPAVGLHLFLGLPEGRLGTNGRRLAAWAGYGMAVVIGLCLWAARPSLPLWPVWLSGAVAAVLGFPASNRRYVTATAGERQRLQWVGCAVVVVAEAVLLISALRLLAGWPDSGAVAAGAMTVLVPLSFVAGTSKRLVGRVDRILVHTVSAAGLTGVVVSVYLVVVLG